MNIRTVSLFALGAMALCGAGARALAAEAPATAPAETPAPLVTETARPDRIVYSPQLPSVAQLTQTAQAQGLTIANITQTAAEIAVTYRLQDGSTRTVSYQPLPLNADGTAAVAPAPNTVVTPAPVQVVEVPPPAPRVVYRYRYYDPFYDDPFYWGRPAPVSLHLGFGFGSHYRPHHYHGHFRHHRRW